MKIFLAQFDFVVGDIAQNTRRIIDAAEHAHQENAALLVTPELALCGYACEDLFLRPSFIQACDKALLSIIKASKEWPELTLVVGHPSRTKGVLEAEKNTAQSALYNCASVIQHGWLCARYAKRDLPNYQVFDEKRYFEAGDHHGLFDLTHQGQTTRVALLICEDAWRPKLAQHDKELGAQLFVVLNASPFHANKAAERERIMRQLCLSTQTPLIYTHIVGGQDELVFDGYSFALNADGSLAARASGWCEELYSLTAKKTPLELCGAISPHKSELEDLWQALVMGIRGYLSKSGFKRVLLGLSGGIDSAVVLAAAVDALGSDQVLAVMMPSPYTASMSCEDASQMAKNLNVRYEDLSIKALFEDFKQSLAPLMAKEPHSAGTTEENLQARIRGVLLMALSNQSGALLLTTGNKSEMATGYCTLYGDMAGGFAVIKDVLKTQVYALARWRNEHDPFGCGVNIIPTRIIERAPSAELRPEQTDQDNLPPYDVLDAIIVRYMEKNESLEHIIKEEKIEAEVVRKVVRLLQLNEYKRRQAPIGVRLSMRSFGKDWRYPICNRFLEYLE